MIGDTSSPVNCRFRRWKCATVIDWRRSRRDEPAPAARFNIRSIPTLIVFRAGKEIARQSGAMDAGALTRWLNSVV